MPTWFIAFLFSLQLAAAQNGLLRVPLFKQQRTTAETPELLLGRYQNDPKSEIPLINYMDSEVCLHGLWTCCASFRRILAVAGGHTQ